MRGPQRHRFIADVMLGKLAKWLRIMGYDTLYSNSMDDHDLLRIAIQQERILLTRDRELFRRESHRSLLIAGDHWPDQLRQLIDQLHLRVSVDPLSRCCRCNELLHPTDRKEMRGLVPTYVFTTQERFFLCPGCGRIYWSGTHVEQMRRKLREIVGGGGL